MLVAKRCSALSAVVGVGEDGNRDGTDDSVRVDYQRRGEVRLRVSAKTELTRHYDSRAFFEEKAHPTVEQEPESAGKLIESVSPLPHNFNLGLHPRARRFPRA